MIWRSNQIKIDFAAKIASKMVYLKGSLPWIFSKKTGIEQVVFLGKNVQ